MGLYIGIRMEKQTKNILNLKTISDDCIVEYDVQVKIDNLSQERAELDKLIAENQLSIDELDSEINRLTNQADYLDNTIAVASGVLAGLVDSLFVGEFNFAELKADSNKFINDFIEKFASKNGYDGQGRLGGAIGSLEDEFPVDQDNIWKGKGISSARFHHLEDLAHHPTPAGLAAAIIVSFLRVAIFVDKNGHWHFLLVDTNPKQLLKIWLPIIISGVMLWLIHLAKSKYPDKLDKLPSAIKKIVVALAATPAVIQILEISYNWFGHLVSDMGGSKNTAGEGMGLPGLFLALLKELSSIPPLNITPLPKFVSDIYSKDKFDMRAELAVVEHLGKQAVPVLLNEIIVRTFYFVRRLILEKQKYEKWNDVNWKNVLPYGNRTINRMLTISSGTFVAVDLADAAIRSAAKSGGEVSLFLTNMILRVNFVGVGRFAIAIYSDAKMGYKRGNLREERIKLMNSQIYLKNARMFYKQADMWVEAETATKAVDEVYSVAHCAAEKAFFIFQENLKSAENISIYTQEIETMNPDLIKNIGEIVKY